MSKKNDIGYQVDWELEYKLGERFFWLGLTGLMGLIWWIGFYTAALWVFNLFAG